MLHYEQCTARLDQIELLTFKRFLQEYWTSRSIVSQSVSLQFSYRCLI